jgi:hypothetical protein
VEAPILGQELKVTALWNVVPVLMFNVDPIVTAETNTSVPELNVTVPVL